MIDMGDMGEIGFLEFSSGYLISLGFTWVYWGSL